MPRLAYLLAMTPRETWRLVRRRVPGLRGGRAWSAAELMSSGKHARGIRFAEWLLRQEAVVRRHMDWAPLAFEGRRVVEIGCGPLAGFGPLVLFCGAESFESAEPDWDPALLHDPAVVEGYLRVFHADLVALYGPRMDFAAFRTALDRRMRIHRGGFEAAPIQGPVDVVLSQSVLEHVFPLEPTIARLAAIQGPQTRSLHLVNLGNHYPTPNPFAGLYAQTPADYVRRRGKAINLLRAPDIGEAFRAGGLAVEVVPARVLAGSDLGPVHPWWRERYDEAALSIQLALVAGPASAAGVGLR